MKLGWRGGVGELGGAGEGFYLQMKLSKKTFFAHEQSDSKDNSSNGKNDITNSDGAPSFPAL